MLDRRHLLAWVGLGFGGLAGLGLRAGRGPEAAVRLRPPGARSEADFLASCIRCGQCALACPVDAVRMTGLAPVADAGTPFVETRSAPCDLCQGQDELLCIEACPTGALRPVAEPADVRMGLAEIDEQRCLAFNSVTCRACWHACPFPDRAIALDRRGRPVIQDACVGCGLCDRACLTEPSSIRVVPRGGA